MKRGFWRRQRINTLTAKPLSKKPAGTNDSLFVPLFYAGIVKLYKKAGKARKSPALPALNAKARHLYLKKRSLDYLETSAFQRP